ncbi:OpgC family protein [Sulfitobacter dubius]|uniref:OpgC family protein n=1 Tax=Sulfitobacter dubius TaxID=218673 RepID=UPI0008EFAF05|nr:OpgC domain-containing protein [Sulfitobacter dubius]SFH32238.1 hypothetical protein SAMN04488039_104206 [Sulfitobacter dubius]
MQQHNPGLPPAAAAVGTVRVGKAPRDPRIDVFRGIALVMIFINHVPGNPYEYLTIRNLGFADAAEAFFLMSGIAAGLAYTPRFIEKDRMSHGLWRAIAPLWKRAWSLYVVQIALSAVALGIFAAAFQITTQAEFLTKINMRQVFQNPTQALIGIPLLTHQFGYVNILPAYSVLLVCAPAAIMLGLRRPRLLLALSLTLWLVTGIYRLNLPNYPNPGGWFFNPFAWQAIFICGLLVGLSQRQGYRFFPQSRALFWLSVTVLLGILAWKYVPGLGQFLNLQMHHLREAGVPFNLTSHDKTYLSAPRFIHILALGYFLSQLPTVTRMAAHRMASPFRLIGQHGLLIFASGTVLALFCQTLMLAKPEAVWMVWVLPVLGTGALLGIAWIAEASRRVLSAPPTAAERQPALTGTGFEKPLTVQSKL